MELARLFLKHNKRKYMIIRYSNGTTVVKIISIKQYIREFLNNLKYFIKYIITIDSENELKQHFIEFNEFSDEQYENRNDICKDAEKFHEKYFVDKKTKNKPTYIG